MVLWHVGKGELNKIIRRYWSLEKDETWSNYWDMAGRYWMSHQYHLGYYFWCTACELAHQSMMVVYGQHGAPLPACKHTTINKHTMWQDYVIKSMPFKSRQVDESSSLMFACCDSRTTIAEHQWQQQRNIYVVYGPPRDWYARFVMPAMFGASAAEVHWLPISSHDSGGPGDGMLASQALPLLLLPGFLHSTWVGIGIGLLFFAYSIHWKCQEHP